ncbi:sensor histidine kinase [Mucilaginibacter auburnensis]|uniref:Histidine kinase n=1 Tax=Mucilaginibacter auburnensis TaxID=1457233 RepID=A0A2H9VS41_9SPHI|nr:histidine kinase [Mucilaginibacter auburnensis]PJJ83609.1 histidine kinase [Mucilaginibacter auburnensis]
MKATLIRHLIFWTANILVITIIFGAQIGHYIIALPAVLMVMPVHALYFYTLTYYIIPRYFFGKRYLLLCLSSVICIVVAGLLFRSVDILAVDPYFFDLSKNPDNHFKWHIPEGTFFEKLLEPASLASAFIGSNSVVWIGVSVKAVKMWYDKREAATQAELSFLKSQIHPHFLFNTLNNLYVLALDRSAKTPGVIMGLSGILRYMLYECHADLVLLKDDVEILHNYISLEKIRYEDRLDLNVHINESISTQKIAPLLLLPLVENAFKHGVSNTEDEPWITIELKVKDQHLTFKVSNSKSQKITTSHQVHFDKIGLQNVRKRLEMLYPGRHRLAVHEEDDVFIATLHLELGKDA